MQPVFGVLCSILGFYLLLPPKGVGPVQPLLVSAGVLLMLISIITTWS